jgi:hypothetical protein
MKNSTLIFVFNFLFLFSYQQLLFGQSYDHLIALADSAHNVKNYHLSGSYFEKAFTIDKAKSIDLFNAACTWSLVGNSKKSLNYLELSFNSEMPITWEFVVNDDDLNFIKKQKEFKILESKYHHHDDSVLHFPKVVEIIMNSSEPYIKFRNKSIVMPSSLLESKKLFASLGFKDSVFNIPNKNVDFINCIFTDENEYFESYLMIENWNIRTLRFFNDTGGFKDISTIEVINSTISYYLLFDKTDKDISLSSSSIGSLSVQKYAGNKINSTITIAKSNIYDAWIAINYLKKLKLIDNKFNYNTKSENDLNARLAYPTVVIGGTISNVELRNNSFISADGIKATGNFSINCNKFQFRKNHVNYPISFDGSVINDQLEIVENSFDLVSFSGAVFPEFNTYIPFQQFNNYKIATVNTSTSRSLDLISSQFDEGFDDKENFEKLIYQYQRLYNNYRLRGEIESANQCYMIIKSLHIERYKNIQATDPTLRNYFKLKIAQLLGFYVEHGTNPEKAIVISIYILFAFAIFYFFFPSEWDTTSKARLISNFRDFRQKNDKGYFKPFFIMLGGFSLSLLNAFTLSLNSFVTLGFGTIPTKGLARYVCILQGFIGWFLLSIFTVALINQVLA